MPCLPLDQGNFSIPAPSPGSPGFGNLVPQLPPFTPPISPVSLQDLNDLFQELTMYMPFGQMNPNFEPDYMKTILAGIYDLLNQFMIFLIPFKFFIPILEIILCIIEILCALMNPFKLARAIIRLFRICIPAFFSLFPIFALILAIISLLLLILTLLLYLIGRIIVIIELIVKNIETLILAVGRADNASISAILLKVGNLLCGLQNLFVIFGVISLIIEVIKALLSLVFRIPPCDSSDSSSDGCCSPDVCPAFIKNNAGTGITSSTGFFQYFNEVDIDSGLTLPAGFPPIISVIRQESWQFYDPNLVQDQQFINITNAFDLPAGTTKIFFPNGTNYTDTSDPTSVPYTINFTVPYNPTVYGVNSPDPTSYAKGARNVQIMNAIVVAPPTNGISSYNDTLIAPFDGTLNLIGGTVAEADGTPIPNPNNNNIAYTVDEFFHQQVNNSGITSPTDGILYSNLTYTFNFNTEVLVGYGIITVGCMPDVADARNFINTTIGSQFNTFGVNLSALQLPDVNAAQQCIFNNVATLQQSISLESVAAFQTNILACLATLQNETNAALTQAITAGFDQYTSTFSIDPTIQFTTLPITVSVSLQEASGNPITNNIPSNVASMIADQISGTVSFGELSPFTYDGYQLFTAELTSNQAGNGTIMVQFNNNYISDFSNPSDIDITPSVSITVVPYTFVETSIIIPEPRRDASDVAREGG